MTCCGLILTTGGAGVFPPEGPDTPSEMTSVKCLITGQWYCCYGCCISGTYCIVLHSLYSVMMIIVPFNCLLSSLLLVSTHLFSLSLLISSHLSSSPCLFSSLLFSFSLFLLSLSPLNLSLVLISRDIRNGLTLVSRAHQLVMDGFNWSHSMNVVTIFRYTYSTVLLRSVV